MVEQVFLLNPDRGDPIFIGINRLVTKGLKYDNDLSRIFS